MDYSKITDVRVGGIDTKDYPDFCDAYIESAEYNGEPMSDDLLEELNEDYDFVYDAVMNQLT
tara:strand:+ start:3830 stop:4015 length:186 start_codon:yes stop_codon:yes gene_type:complete